MFKMTLHTKGSLKIIYNMVKAYSPVIIMNSKENFRRAQNNMAN
jgi:hypothetical protein